MKPQYTMIIFDENKIPRDKYMELPWECIADLTMYQGTKMSKEEIKNDILEQVMPFIED